MAGPSLPEALFAALAQVLAGGASLASGSWCTAVDCGRERYLRIQVFGLARTLVTTAGVALLALGGLGPARALIIVSFAQVVLELSRFVVCSICTQVKIVPGRPRTFGLRAGMKF